MFYQQIRYRFRQKHGNDFVDKEVGQNINQGDQQNDLPQGRQEQGGLGIAQGNKRLLAGDLNAENAGGSHVDPQGLGGVCHQLWVVVEDQHESPGEQLHRRPQHQGIGETGSQQRFESIPDPLGIPGAEVVADNGLGTLGQALEGHHGQLHDADQHSHAAHRDITAVFQQGGVEAHGDQALRGLHDKGG